MTTKQLSISWLDAFAVPELLRPAVRKLLAGERMAHVTARLHGLKVLTSDSKILQYPHVGSVASRKA